jgi:O-6-methylguanine DNA methyltransferase
LARVNLSLRELQSGALRVRITVDADGALHDIKLPDAVPENLTPADLSGMLVQLAQFPRLFHGAPFTRRVWERMSAIPWGHALTYQELAEEVGSPLACRAVGQACAKNPLPLIVPCHRVLANEGLGGFAYGTAWKSALLTLETETRPN